MFKFTFHEFMNTKKNCKEIKACSSYEGKSVTASAFVHPDDAYDYETGKKIAEIRCEQKLLKKKISRFIRKRKDVDTEIEHLQAKIRALRKRKDAYKKTCVDCESKMFANTEALISLTGKDF